MLKDLLSWLNPKSCELCGDAPVERNIVFRGWGVACCHRCGETYRKQRAKVPEHMLDDIQYMEERMNASDR